MTSEPNGPPGRNGGATEVLARSSLFRFVPQEHRPRLQGLVRRASLEVGDLIKKQGEPADAFFMIISGRAHVVRLNENSEELSLSFLGPGAEFGESALLAGGRSEEHTSELQSRFGISYAA